MWICLRCRQNIVVKGEMHHYAPGDWVNVGRQIALEWVEAGLAYTVSEADKQDIGNTTGILVRGALSEDYRLALSQVSGLQFAFAENATPSWLPFGRTLIYKPEFQLRLDLMVVGFNWLKKWQMVVPLWDYETLACSVGSEAERAQTEAVIRDLRVPLRDTRLIFVRRCDTTRALIQSWHTDMETGSHEQLAFMRALYTHKPVMCDAPAQWTGRVK